MNYEDESYVRLYTRRTMNRRLIGWEGRAVLAELMLEGGIDRAGVFEIEDVDPAEAVAMVTGLPIEVAKVGLERCIQRGILELNGRFLVWPNWIKGQTAKKSDGVRQADSRGRRRDEARAVSRGIALGHAASHDTGSSSQPVTDVGPNVTGRDSPTDGVTEGHVQSQPVTPILSKSSLSETSLAPLPPTGSAGEPDDNSSGPAVLCPSDLWDHVPLGTRSNLEIAGIHPEAQRAHCVDFAGKNAHKSHLARPIWRWVSTWHAVVSADRPKRPPPPSDPEATRKRREAADAASKRRRAEELRREAEAAGVASPADASPAALDRALRGFGT